MVQLSNMFRLVAVAAILLGLTSQAFAWGGDGHQIAALIAEERLTPEAQAGIKALLGDANISCHGALQNRPRRGASKPASIVKVHIPHVDRGCQRCPEFTFRLWSRWCFQQRRVSRRGRLTEGQVLCRRRYFAAPLNLPSSPHCRRGAGDSFCR